MNEVQKYPQKVEDQMKWVYQTLNEKDRRHYAAVEASKLGHGGISYVSDLFGCSRQTIHTGLQELEKKR